MNKVFLTCGARRPCQYFQWIHTPPYPEPSQPVPEWLKRLTATLDENRRAFKQRRLKSVNLSPNNESFYRKYTSISNHMIPSIESTPISPNHESFYRKDTYVSNNMIPEEQRLKQFGESAKKQKEEQDKDFRLPSEFAWTPEIAEYYKKKEEAKKFYVNKKQEEPEKQRQIHFLWRP